MLALPDISPSQKPIWSETRRFFPSEGKIRSGHRNIRNIFQIPRGSDDATERHGVSVGQAYPYDIQKIQNLYELVSVNGNNVQERISRWQEEGGMFNMPSEGELLDQIWSPGNIILTVKNIRKEILGFFSTTEKYDISPDSIRFLNNDEEAFYTKVYNTGNFSHGLDIVVNPHLTSGIPTASLLQLHLFDELHKRKEAPNEFSYFACEIYEIQGYTHKNIYHEVNAPNRRSEGLFRKAGARHVGIIPRKIDINDFAIDIRSKVFLLNIERSLGKLSERYLMPYVS